MAFLQQQKRLQQQTLELWLPCHYPVLQRQMMSGSVKTFLCLVLPSFLWQAYLLNFHSLELNGDLVDWQTNQKEILYSMRRLSMLQTDVQHKVLLEIHSDRDCFLVSLMLQTHRECLHVLNQNEKKMNNFQFQIRKLNSKTLRIMIMKITFNNSPNCPNKLILFCHKPILIIELKELLPLIHINYHNTLSK